MSKPTVTITDEDGNELSIPAHFEVCPRCEGEGSHVNPAVDGNGLTAEDFAPSRLSPDQQAAYSRYALAQAEYERDYNSERWLRYAESGVMG
jgi:hypothetical protein